MNQLKAATSIINPKHQFQEGACERFKKMGVYLIKYYIFI